MDNSVLIGQDLVCLFLFDQDRYSSCGLCTIQQKSVITFIASTNFRCQSLEGPLKLHTTKYIRWAYPFTHLCSTIHSYTSIHPSLYTIFPNLVLYIGHTLSTPAPLPLTRTDIPAHIHTHLCVRVCVCNLNNVIIGPISGGDKVSCTPKDKVGGAKEKPLNIETKWTGTFSLSDPLIKQTP